MKRGLKTIIAGVSVVVIGILVAVSVFLPLVRGASTENQFKVPGQWSVRADEPGRYYVWDNYRTLFEGTRYEREAGLPDGMTIEIQDARGNLLPLSGDGSVSWTVGNHSKSSVGYVEIEEAGEIQVRVHGGGGEDRILSFSRSALLDVMGKVFMGIGIAMLMGVVGTGIAIWGIVKLIRSPA